MMSIASLLCRLLADAIAYARLLLRSSNSQAAEILFLRKQRALYQERNAPRNPTDPGTRITMALLSNQFHWRDALVIVQPKTLIRWHRLGFRLFWRYKSRPGRPRIPVKLRKLIREMAFDNVFWGEERIANELLLNTAFGSRRGLYANTCQTALAEIPVGTNCGKHPCRITPGHCCLRFLCGGDCNLPFALRSGNY